MTSGKCETCADGKKYTNLSAHMRKHVNLAVKAEAETVKEPIEDSDEVKQPLDMQDAIKTLVVVSKSLQESIGKIDQRLTSIETGGKYDFKHNPNPDDIAHAEKVRDEFGVDPRVRKIVDEVLGTDFGVRVGQNENNPGYRLDIVVPPRLSEIAKSRRAVPDPQWGRPGHEKRYLENKFGEVIEEEYQPEDVRSRAIGSAASFDAIREHCTNVQANIVRRYEVMKKPLPAFRTAR